MSNWRDRVDEESGLGVLTAWTTAYYHYVALALLVVFALWNRTRLWENFVVRGEVLYSGNDPWYHLRNVQYIVDNFPATMLFDPWTYFPFGTANAQFGTLFDQIVATIALVVGLGNPSDQLVRLVVLFSPALFGVAVIVPAYFIGRRLGGRAGGVISASVIALGAGALLSRSVVGTADHHVAEALFQALAVLGMMKAVSVAEDEKPVWELVAGPETAALRRTLGWSLLGGVAVGAYLWVWPPGVLLLGILGLFFIIHLSAEYVRGRSPEHAAFAGAVALGTAGVLQFGTVEVLDITATDRSVLQPGLAFAVAAGAVFLAWLARQWDRRDQPAALYPLAVAVLLVASGLLFSVGLPDLFGFFVKQVDRVLGFMTPTSATAGTVGEAQPGNLGQLLDAYKLATVTALLGALALLAKQVLDEEVRGEGLLVVLWAAFMIAATLTQARFAYYLAVPVGALNAALVGIIVRRFGPVRGSVEIEAYQVLTIAAVVLLVVAPMVFGIGGPTATAVAAGNSGAGGIVGWQNSLTYLDEETPAEGQYGAPNATALEYYPTVPRTGDFDYPSGAYGVMSWWDYGHWITVQGGRIPNANPFQQGSKDAARFLLAGNESQAGAVLDDVEEDDAKTRYVMVDWKMAETDAFRPTRGKFFAPPTFADNVSKSDFYSRIINRQQFEQTGGIVRSTVTMRHKQPYYESMVTRLYLFHGSAAEPRSFVLDWQGQERRLLNNETFTFGPQDGAALKTFSNVSAAREYVANDDTSQVGGVGPYPSERVPALEQYRLVQMSNRSALSSRGYVRGVQRTIRQTGLSQIVASGNENLSQSAVQQRVLNFLFQRTPAWTKVFERVPGATIEGTGPPNATIRLSVPMQPQNGGPFQYTQQVETGPDGEFSTTVPYSTTGYANWGPDQGYTNVSVRAAGPYQVRTGARFNESNYLVRSAATVNVSEAAVIGEDPGPITVELEREVLGSPQEESGESDGSGGTGDTSNSNDTNARTVEPAVGAPTVAP
jgi:dolichyl-diphosphooligosaccharide--protein glycosyltransferase